jgi:hypothetical protein
LKTEQREEESKATEVFAEKQALIKQKVELFLIKG